MLLIFSLENMKGYSSAFEDIVMVHQGRIKLILYGVFFTYHEQLYYRDSFVYSCLYIWIYFVLINSLDNHLALYAYKMLIVCKTQVKHENQFC